MKAKLKVTSVQNAEGSDSKEVSFEVVQSDNKGDKSLVTGGELKLTGPASQFADGVRAGDEYTLSLSKGQ